VVSLDVAVELVDDLVDHAGHQGITSREVIDIPRP
jgi:hypothetical protein